VAAFTEDIALPLGGNHDGFASVRARLAREVSTEGVRNPAFDEGPGIGIREVRAFSEQCPVDMQRVLAHSMLFGAWH
jgi:hypothetical protein